MADSYSLEAAATACNNFSMPDSCCKDVPKRQLGPCTEELYPHASYDDQPVENCQDQSKILCPSSLQMSTEPSELAVQDGIVPLLGNPYFTSIMSEGHIRDFIAISQFNDNLPDEQILVVLEEEKIQMWEMYFDDASSIKSALRPNVPKARLGIGLIFIAPNGGIMSNEWVVKCCVYDHKKKLENGWGKFVVDNNLRIGDGCVFELMNFKESYPLKFKVQILDGQIPQTNQVGVADLPPADYFPIN